MGDISENYHIRAEDVAAGVDLLTKAQAKGFVFPPTAGWVSMLVEGMYLMADRSVVEANTGWLLHYQTADDHGWGFELYHGQETVSRYLLRMESGSVIDDSETNYDALCQFLTAHTGNPEPRAELEHLLRPEVDIELFGFQPHADGFAKLMGLTRYEDLSYQEYLLEYDPEVSVLTGVVQVG